MFVKHTFSPHIAIEISPPCENAFALCLIGTFSVQNDRIPVTFDKELVKYLVLNVPLRANDEIRAPEP